MKRNYTPRTQISMSRERVQERKALNNDMKTFTGKIYKAKVDETASEKMLSKLRNKATNRERRDNLGDIKEGEK